MKTKDNRKPVRKAMPTKGKSKSSKKATPIPIEDWVNEMTFVEGKDDNGNYVPLIGIIFSKKIPSKFVPIITNAFVEFLKKWGGGVSSKKKQSKRTKNRK